MSNFLEQISATLLKVMVENMSKEDSDTRVLLCAELTRRLEAGQTPVIEHKDFGKISRFRLLEVTLTEKIDGSNVQVYVPEDPSQPVLAGSRNRWISPEKGKDMSGFAAFVRENELAIRRLGVGRHFGEWWGQGIQRKYGLDHKRLSLFNVDRFSGGLPQGMPENVSLVPVLYKGQCDQQKIQEVVDALYLTGSQACPGWMKPEGVVITVGGQRFKVSDMGDQHKGAA